MAGFCKILYWDRLCRRARFFIFSVFGCIPFVVWVGMSIAICHHLRAAEVFLRAHDYDAAKRHLDSCWAIRPGQPKAHLLAARLDRATGRYASAERHLALCKQAHGGLTEEASLEWILLRAQKGEFLELEQQMTQAVAEGHPQRFLIQEALIDCLVDERRFHTVHSYLDKWVHEEPNSIKALFLRAWVGENLNRLDEARRDYARAHKLAPERTDIAALYLHRLFEDKNFKEAGEAAKTLKDHAPESVEASYFWGLHLYFQGQLVEAEKCFDEILRQQPAHVAALFQKAKVIRQKGQFSDAATWFRRVLDQKPGHAEARYGLYQVLQQQPGHEKLAALELSAYKETLEEAKRMKKLVQELEKRPRDVELLLSAGSFFLRQGEDSLGQYYLHKALTIQPNHRIARDILARHYEKKEQQKKSKAPLSMVPE